MAKTPTKIAPKYKKVLRAFACTNPEDIKVIIIGTSSVNDPKIANGLAFSRDQESASSTGIDVFDKASYNAGIRNFNHYQWAKNGVLLLNAALTISEGNQKEEMKKHNDRWFNFMKQVLTMWLRQYSNLFKIDRPLFVITAGYKDKHRNYAESLWNSILIPYGTVIKKRGIHHPTFPEVPKDADATNNAQVTNNTNVIQNRFIPQMTFCLKEILETYRYIFGDDKDIVNNIQSLNINIS